MHKFHHVLHFPADDLLQISLTPAGPGPTQDARINPELTDKRFPSAALAATGTERPGAARAPRGVQGLKPAGVACAGASAGHAIPRRTSLPAHKAASKVTSPCDGRRQLSSFLASSRVVIHEAVPWVVPARHSWNNSCKHSTVCSRKRVSRGLHATAEMSQLGTSSSKESLQRRSEKKLPPEHLHVLPAQEETRAGTTR